MSPSRGDHRLILASGSPRRRELLEMLGLPFGVIVPAVDETRKTSELPDRYVVRVARDKALAVARQEPGAVVLAADTAVVLRAEEVFGKPRSPEEAVAMLQRLEGRTHQVMSAVAVAQGERVEHAIDITDVTFRTLPQRMIEDYVATGEALDKAGAYAVQGRGAALVEGIRGDFFGVMGLPLRLALELLERFGMTYRFMR
ncbi:MAG: hypothetical protein DMD47_00960 [Gemmatimonadetes bacterium]|nr:MAG: hypothetical protein DMD47_00960 [Gemmatimonadota bacterium]